MLGLFQQKKGQDKLFQIDESSRCICGVEKGIKFCISSKSVSWQKLSGLGSNGNSIKMSFWLRPKLKGVTSEQFCLFAGSHCH